MNLLKNNKPKIIALLVLLAAIIFTYVVGNIFANVKTLDKSASVFVSNGKLSNNPQRIVSGIPSITEMLFALGLKDRIVGVTINCNYPPEAQKKEKVGRETLNVEKILSLKPDLVVLLDKTQDLDKARLAKFNIQTVTVRAKNYQEVKTSLLELGKITGADQRALELVRQMDSSLKKLILPKKAPKVLVLVGWRPLVTIGANSFISEMVQMAGGVNVATAVKGDYPILSFEEVLHLDPDVIILPTNLVNAQKEIYNEGRWFGLGAVKGRQVYLVDADLISRPGPRFVEAVIAINKILNKVKIK